MVGMGARLARGGRGRRESPRLDGPPQRLRSGLGRRTARPGSARLHGLGAAGKLRGEVGAVRGELLGLARPV